MNQLTQFSRGFSLFPVFLVLYEMTTYLSNDMYLPALPQIAKDLRITASLAQQTLTVFFLGSACLQLLLGPLSDRWGRRPIMFLGGLLFIVSTLFCMLATNIHALLITRFFQGCAICFVVTAGYSSIHELYTHTRAIQILAIMGSVTILAPAFGPLLGSVALQWFTWRGIFGLLLISAGIALLALWFCMPESSPKGQRHPLSWQKLFNNYLAVLQNKVFMRNTLMGCCVFSGMIAWIAAGPFLVITKFHLTTFMFGFFQAMVFGSFILGTQLVNHLIKKVVTEDLIKWGLKVTVFSGFLALCLTWLFPQFLLGLIFSLMFFTFGSALIGVPAQRIAIEACTVPMGARMAVYFTILGLGGFLGGFLVAMTYTGTLVWFGILLLIVATIGYLIKKFF